MAMIDVTVRGAGIFGLAVAWACQRRGARVRVIDPRGVGGGASGGIVGALAPHVPETWNDKKAFQLDSLLMAPAFWAEVAAAGGADPGYLQSGRLQPIADDAALAMAQTRGRTAQTLWQGRAAWQILPAADYGAWAPVSATGWLIHDTLTARLHPRRATAALAAAIQAGGGDISPDAPEAGQVVEATGYEGLVALSTALDRKIGDGVKGQAALLRHDARSMPQLFADAIHIVPHADGTVAIGSTSENQFDDPRSTDAELEDIIARARAAFPVIADAPVLERWAGVRPRARSRAPLLGPDPRDAMRFIANGGFKIGYGMAPKVGEVMADLILDGRDNIPAGFHTRSL